MPGSILQLLYGTHDIEMNTLGHKSEGGEIRGHVFQGCKTRTKIVSLIMLNHEWKSVLLEMLKYPIEDAPKYDSLH